MNVIAFDTCGPLLGVALWDGESATERVREAGRGSDKHLLGLVRELLQRAGIEVSDLDGVAVAGGPGAFTGLRVGLATAAGLAQALDKPVVVAGSLHTRALAAGLASQGPSEELLTLLDARKKRVYASLWRGQVRVEGPSDVAPEVAMSWCDAGFRATGQGAGVYGVQVRDAGGVLVDDPDNPGVTELARMGAERLAAGEGIAAAEVRPTYVRVPDAVENSR